MQKPVFRGAREAGGRVGENRARLAKDWGRGPHTHRNIHKHTTHTHIHKYVCEASRRSQSDCAYFVAGEKGGKNVEQIP